MHRHGSRGAAPANVTTDLSGLNNTAVDERAAVFSAVLDIAADAIITIDADQRVLLFNRGAAEIFGWRESEVRGQSLDVLIPERFRGAHRRHIEAFREGAIDSRRMAERRPIYGLRRDGSEFPAEASLAKVSREGQTLMTVILRDITFRQRQSDDANFLSEASAVVNAAFESDELPQIIASLVLKRLGHACVLLLMESSLVDEGSYRCSVSAADPGDASILKELCEVTHDGPRNWPLPMEDVALVGDMVVRERLEPGWERNGAPSPEAAKLADALEIRAFVVLPLRARGKLLGALAVLRQRGPSSLQPEEIALASTYAERAALVIDNARLYRRAHLATIARDEVLSVVSHDLRNPLSAIRMCARVLADQPPSDELHRHHLATSILDAVAQMQRLIQDLLDVSLLESGHFTLRREPTLLAEVVETVATMVRADAAERGLALICDVEPDLPAIDVDPARLTQAVANLASNAVKFTAHGGTVVLCARRRGDVVYLGVRDTGIGIPASDLPRIFDRYWQSRRADRTLGAGLGLAIAKGIVEAHGGRLSVRSELGKGSTFTCGLPFSIPPSP